MQINEMMNIRSGPLKVNMKFLGIDFGEKRMGLAVSDELGFFARGLCTLSRKGVGRDLEFIKDIVEREGIGKIILGLPVSLNGNEGPQCDRVRRFAATLEEKIGIPVEYVDEVLSSEEAKEVMALRPRRNKAKKEEVDRIAAAIILQRYLDSINRKD